MDKVRRDLDAKVDAALIHAAQHGIRWCWDLLMVKHYLLIWGLARRYGEDAEDVEDLAAEAVAHLYAKRASFRGSAAFTTWMYVSANNYLQDLLAQRARNPLTAAQAVGENGHLYGR